ncbi:MAG: helix-turn-helix domain-containing protein [Candidatus Roizmanbacteria bacterium]|nr:helix-turn-helix domain-containing protein [Candidatus Roizmanbacteria bacterium]
MAKPVEKIKARLMRKNGESIKAIARKIKVSPSTVSLWVRDIELTQLQLRQLEKNLKDPHYGRRHAYLKKIMQKRIRKEEQLLKRGIRRIGLLTRRELLLAGTALYWAEGFKKDSQVGFANTDPTMIQLFMRWIIECCGFNKSDLSPRVTINISHMHRIEKIQNYWSEITQIPVSQFQKPYFQQVQWKKQFENEDEYFGVLRMKVRKSIDSLRLIKGWVEGLKLNSDTFH